MKKTIKGIAALLCVLSFMVTATEIPGTDKRNNQQVVYLTPVVDLTQAPLEVVGYAESLVRNESGVIVVCTGNSGICMTINEETGVACVDPDGCNPNIGLTYVPLRRENGQYFEILYEDDNTKTVQLFTPAGYQRRGG
jgi:hypothetical protein